METILEFASSWWGIIFWVVAAALALFGVEVLIEREVLLKRVRDLIFLAEEKSRQGALQTGSEKFQWVVDNGHGLLPPVLGKFISEDLFKIIVQSIYDRITGWALQKSLK